MTKQERRVRDLELIRAMCAGGTLLTSEIRNTPLTNEPPAKPGGGGGADPSPEQYGENTSPVAFVDRVATGE